jgi:glutathione S-transferase
MCRSVELGFDEKLINSQDDMADIIERNPNRSLPVLQHNDLFLTEGTAILKYISEIINKLGNSAKWPGLAWPSDFVQRAKQEEILSYCQSFVKPSIRDYINSQQAVMYDSVPDTSKYDKLRGVLQDLDYKKKGHYFLVNDNLTIVDLLTFACLYPLCVRSDHSWDKLSRLEGWFKVMKKIIVNEWKDEKSCLDCYESESDEEDYQLAETVMECVKNDRPDILDKIAKEGANINMPLAVVEAVNRGNLSILKVMRDHNCYLKWPMAISMALRLAKGESMLALLFGPGQSPEERKKEAEEILANENRKMRVALGLPPEPTPEEIKVIEAAKKKSQEDQKRSEEAQRAMAEANAKAQADSYVKK